MLLIGFPFQPFLPNIIIFYAFLSSAFSLDAGHLFFSLKSLPSVNPEIKSRTAREKLKPHMLISENFAWIIN